jgi:hypothetical protein
MVPKGSPETPAHICHYALRNNKEDRQFHRQQYEALLN